MSCHRRTLADHAAAVRAGSLADGVAIVDLDAGVRGSLPALHGGVGAVVVGTTEEADPLDHPAIAGCDVVVGPDDPAVDAIARTVLDHPIAAEALVRLFRGAPARSIDEGLTVESAVYSTLQAGPEFAAWLAARTVGARADTGAPIALDREGDRLRITLTRPQKRNALDAAMRDALVDAFALPLLDPSITAVELTGSGPDFCAGGDLDEFGTFSDPASAHLLRLQQSVGRAISRVADRVTVRLHGACVGSGIELPAFAGRVVASPDARFSLPEVSLGLIPGAGGTVSLPRRIGRHRTAQMGLSGMALDARMAEVWGLVDVVAPS